MRATGEGRRDERVPLSFIPSSTVKINQILGERDKQLKQPTLSQTYTRYGILGTDLGYSFENDGQLTFLFGDTVGKLDSALDTIATTGARDPDDGIRLNFLTSPGQPYLTIQPPDVDMGAFNVPVSGINIDGRTYVVVRTDHSTNPDAPTDRTLLLRFTRPAKFDVLRRISKLPGGRFINMSMHLQLGPVEGLPGGSEHRGPYVVIWGTGVYRGSDPYLCIVPASKFESGEGTLYFAGSGLDGKPRWSDKESDAKPLFQNGRLGDMSVTWCADLRLWLMTYDNPNPPHIDFRCSRTPWGPWSDPQTIFRAPRDGYGKFIHEKGKDDGLAGPVIGKGQADPQGFSGGCYAPYVVERWTKLRGSELSVYFVLSVWNPYVVELMGTRFRVVGADALSPPRMGQGQETRRFPGTRTEAVRKLHRPRSGVDVVIVRPPSL